MSNELTVKESAKVLGVSPQRVRMLCRDGTVKARKVGTNWLVKKKSLDRFGVKKTALSSKGSTRGKVSRSVQKPIALSFFSGAMGIDLGIEKAGFDIRLACEVDKYCRQSIALNRPDTALLGDICDYSADEVREAARLRKRDRIDLIMGGPPCQAFSTAGKRKGFNDDRGNVFLRYIDLAIELNPRYFVIENVRGLLSCPLEHRPHDQRGDGFPDLGEDELKGGALNFVTRKLETAGFKYSFNLYNSANFGTPQIRERVIIICSRDGKRPPFLTPTHSENGEFGLPKWNTLKKCIAKIKKHQHLKFPEKRLKYYRMLKPGQNWRNLPVEIQPEAMGKSYFAGGGKTGFYRRLAWDRPSPTLVTHPAMPATDLAHPTKDRPLSVQEYQRIQEFPDSWKFAGPMIQQYKQIGNAVPVSVGFAVGTLISKLLKGKAVKNYPDFKYSRYKNTNHITWREAFNKQLRKYNAQQAELISK